MDTLNFVNSCFKVLVSTHFSVLNLSFKSMTNRGTIYSRSTLEAESLLHGLHAWASSENKIMRLRFETTLDPNKCHMTAPPLGLLNGKPNLDNFDGIPE